MGRGQNDRSPSRNALDQRPFRDTLHAVRRKYPGPFDILPLFFLWVVDMCAPYQAPQAMACSWWCCNLRCAQLDLEIKHWDAVKNAVRSSSVRMIFDSCAPLWLFLHSCVDCVVFWWSIGGVVVECSSSLIVGDIKVLIARSWSACRGMVWLSGACFCSVRPKFLGRRPGYPSICGSGSAFLLGALFRLYTCCSRPSSSQRYSVGTCFSFSLLSSSSCASMSPSSVDFVPCRHDIVQLGGKSRSAANEVDRDAFAVPPHCFPIEIRGVKMRWAISA